MNNLKLNVLLAKVEHLASSWKTGIADRIAHFTKHGKSFEGLRKTYQPRPETVDLPSERASVLVVSTVEENFQWLLETHKDYIDGLFDIEATNAASEKVPLVVDGETFGKFTALELMRLISFLEGGDFRKMYEVLPVRDDSKGWEKSDDDAYKGRDIWELPKQTGIKRETERKPYVLEDKNVLAAIAAGKQINYTPQTAIEEKSKEIGDWTLQHFTGATSIRHRAEILRRYTKLIVAAKEALKKANETEVVHSEMRASKLFGYLHTGKVSEEKSSL